MSSLKGPESECFEKLQFLSRGNTAGICFAISIHVPLAITLKFPTVCIGSKVNIVYFQEPIDVVKSHQERMIQQLKGLDNLMKELQKGQASLQLHVNKIAQKQGIELVEDDYIGEVNDDEDWGLTSLLFLTNQTKSKSTTNETLSHFRKKFEWNYLCCTKITSFCKISMVEIFYPVKVQILNVFL